MNPSRSRPKDRAPARIGQVLRGKWHLDELLAVGGMASVFAATHRNGMRGAVKLLHYELSLDEQSRERFLREGYVANKVAHDGAVRVLDDDVCEDGTVFLVMELLEGMTVDALLRSRKSRTFGLGETLRVADRLLDVLAAAHDKGIVHRDIKPENLFLTNDGRLKVLDFGIARLREASASPGTTRAGDLLGTPSFMPPEQALGNADQVDPRSDVWSVGATMFRLLTGRPVHHAESVNRVLLAAMTMPAPPIASVLPTVPPALSTIVDRALAFAQTDRWPDARAMRAQVRAFAESSRLRSDGPVQATPDEQNARPTTLPLQQALPGRAGLLEDDDTAATAAITGSSQALRPHAASAPKPAQAPRPAQPAAHPLYPPPPPVVAPPQEPPAPPVPTRSYGPAPSPPIAAPAPTAPPPAPVALPAPPAPATPLPAAAPPQRAYTSPPQGVHNAAAPAAPPFGAVTGSHPAVPTPAPGAHAPAYTSPPQGVHNAAALPTAAPAASATPSYSGMAASATPSYSAPGGPPPLAISSFSSAAPVSRDPTFGGGPAPRKNPTALFMVLGAAGLLGALVAVFVLGGSGSSSSPAASAPSAPAPAAPEPSPSPSASTDPAPTPSAEPTATASASADPTPTAPASAAVSAPPTAAVPAAAPSSAAPAPRRPAPSSGAKPAGDPFSSRKW